MKEIALEDSKKIIIKTLESIDRCCRANNIKYSLCWGTMIGAIRHHGFIPWDDDVDLMMSREDLNRFLKVYNDENHCIYTPKQNKNCIQILTKVSNKDTKVFFNNYHKSLFGLWISIFPFDNAPDKGLKFWEWKRTLLMNLYHFKTSRYFTTDSKQRKILKFLLKLLVAPFSSFWIYNRIEKCLTAYNSDRTNNICIWPGDEFTKFIYYPSSLFDEYIDVVFDGVNCMIIKKYDEFMRNYYGDYMQLPPESDRVPRHNYKAYYID